MGEIRRRRSIGRAVLLSAVILAVGGCSDCTGEGTVEVPGNEARFTPIEAFQAVGDLAGTGAELLEIEAIHVRSDGTLDLTIEASRVIYEFQAPWSEAPEQYQGLQVLLRGSDQVGMERVLGDHDSEPLGEVVPPPTCTLSTLWQKAIEEGAPDDRVARILYRMQRPPGMGLDKSPSYSFRIEDADVNMYFDQSCERIQRVQREDSVAQNPSVPVPSDDDDGTEVEAPSEQDEASDD